MISNSSTIAKLLVRRFLLALLAVSLSLSVLSISMAAEETLNLDALIAEGLKSSPDILAAKARAEAAGFRIPQAGSLPDPMFMFGYQNEGFRRITIGEEPNAMGMFSLSQMFYFPGKRGLKGEMATKDAESIAAMYQAARLNVASRIKELYYDLFLAYKNLDILNSRAELFSRIEDAAAARYASGMGMQQEVVMAQTEKYMIMEREEMQRQKVQALQGMLNTTVGREVASVLGRPATLVSTPYETTLDQAIALVRDRSPEVKSKQKMLEGAESKVRMAQKEYYPDVTLSAGYYPKTKGMLDMWNLTASVNLPIFSATKQKQAVLEASAQVSEARRNVAATQLMIDSIIRENHSMVQAADRLMKLYREGLVPKANQDVELSFSGYATGKVEALTVITRIKNLLDYDTLYWQQFVEREKAIARLDALTGSALTQNHFTKDNTEAKGATE